LHAIVQSFTLRISDRGPEGTERKFDMSHSTSAIGSPSAVQSITAQMCHAAKTRCAT